MLGADSDLSSVWLTGDPLKSETAKMARFGGYTREAVSPFHPPPRTNRFGIHERMSQGCSTGQDFFWNVYAWLRRMCERTPESENRSTILQWAERRRPDVFIQSVHTYM